MQPNIAKKLSIINKKEKKKVAQTNQETDQVHDHLNNQYLKMFYSAQGESKGPDISDLYQLRQKYTYILTIGSTCFAASF